MDAPPTDHLPPHRPPSDKPFFAVMIALGLVYVVLVVGMVAADAVYAVFAEPQALWRTLTDPRIVYAAGLSLITCTITAILSLWVAVPIGYLLSRASFPGKAVLDAVLDVPIVLPPLVVGLSLLILFKAVPEPVAGRVVFEVPGVILAQFMVAAAFAVRAMRATYDQIPTRHEDVARTLGASHGQAFARVVLPESRRGMVTAFTLAWARALGEFGPIFVFAGITSFHTEVLTSAVFVEVQAGRLPAALAVSLLMVGLATVVLVLARVFGTRTGAML